MLYIPGSPYLYIKELQAGIVGQGMQDDLSPRTLAGHEQRKERLGKCPVRFSVPWGRCCNGRTPTADFLCSALSFTVVTAYPAQVSHTPVSSHHIPQVS
jgi:hypothetical protein